MIYQLTKFSNQVLLIDGNKTSCIPFDPANTDYQAFLLWKSEGNEPLPADEVTV